MIYTGKGLYRKKFITKKLNEEVEIARTRVHINGILNLFYSLINRKIIINMINV